MSPAALQQWLVEKGQSLVVDGQPGPLTRAAIVAAFTNPCAPAATDEGIAAIAQRLGCAIRQLRTVGRVESSGSGFDASGRPKLLFERHLFYRFTKGRFGGASYSNPERGGYDQDSWDKLTRAACLDPEAAFASASWGRFQVLGAHAGGPTYPGMLDLRYSSPLELAYSTVKSEAAHFELLARYVEEAGLKDALKKLSTNPDDCRAFAAGYNGSGYEAQGYHTKLAATMR